MVIRKDRYVLTHKAIKMLRVSEPYGLELMQILAHSHVLSYLFKDGGPGWDISTTYQALSLKLDQNV